MQPADPTVGLQRCALGDDGWRGVVEQKGCYGEVRVPLPESVMDVVGGVWRYKIKWVVLGVGFVVSNEGCEVGVVVYVEESDGVVYWVGEDVVLTRVRDGVPPYCGVSTNG